MVAVLADDATVAEIKSVLSIRKFNGKTISVKKITSAAQASKFHLVYVSEAYTSKIKSIAKSKNTLVVSEKGQLNNGASIAFVLEDSKLKFKINEPVCAASGLQVSKTLMSLGV